jgi:hypothetical protein
VRQERDAPPLQRTSEVGVGDEAVDTEKSHARALRQARDEAIARMEIGPVGLGMS